MDSTSATWTVSTTTGQTRAGRFAPSGDPWRGVLAAALDVAGFDIAAGAGPDEPIRVSIDGQQVQEVLALFPARDLDGVLDRAATAHAWRAYLDARPPTDLT